MTPSDPRPGFWRRQFHGDRTPGQIVFDVIFGIVLPILCLIFDPVIFRRGFSSSGAMFARGQFLAYTFFGLEILALGVWLVSGSRLKRGAALASGVLWCGGFVSGALGVAIAPLSLLGILILIGFLGFTPFVTAFVFFRNGYRAAVQARRELSALPVAVMMSLSFIAVAGVPMLAHWQAYEQVERALDDIVRGDSERGVESMNRVKALVDLDRLVWAYHKETDPGRKARIADAYRKLTGDDIEYRLSILLD